MGEEKPDTLDFVKDFQEYLSQQTQHVNMISGSVSGVKEADELPAGNVDISSVFSRVKLVDESSHNSNAHPSYDSFQIAPCISLRAQIAVRTGWITRRWTCPWRTALGFWWTVLREPLTANSSACTAATPPEAQRDSSNTFECTQVGELRLNCTGFGPEGKKKAIEPLD